MAACPKVSAMEGAGENGCCATDVVLMQIPTQIWTGNRSWTVEKTDECPFPLACWAVISVCFDPNGRTRTKHVGALELSYENTHGTESWCTR